MAYKRLGDLLIAAGTITPEELDMGLQRQKETKERLGAALISAGIITEAELIEALRLQLGIEYIDLSKTTIPISMAQVVPKNIAKQFQVVPVRMERDELYLAMSDPMNFYAIEEVKKAVRKKIVPMIATTEGVEHAILVLYGNEGAARAIEAMKREAPIEEDNGEEAQFTGNILNDNINDAPTIRLVNSIIERAILERASDIHIEPKEKELQVRMRIDGVLRKILTIPKNLQNSVISRLKIMSGMDIAERRVPQDGRFNVKNKKREFDLRVNSLPTVYGEKIVARLLDKRAGYLTPDSIGLMGDNLKKYQRAIHCTSGVILIAGPTGSGKSSTMNTMISQLNTEEVNVVTLEDPVEYNIDGVNQVQINEKTGMDFANGLRAILRQDPDIIAVGEIRDGETAQISMRAAITGHVVLSTIHTNDAVGTIERLEDIGVEPYLIATALRAVISQRLVRRICPKCKKSYEATDEEVRRLGLSTEHKHIFYRGEGCADCFNTGYRGRIGVFEILEITPEIRPLISRQAGRPAIEQELASAHSEFKTLRENAIQLVEEGITTAEEVQRVIYETGDMKKAEEE
ncbi:MAG: GspE/PulE family protein [Ruminococcus sp.]